MVLTGGTAVAVVAIALFAVAHEGSPAARAGVFGSSLLLGGAAFAVGALAGLVFGVPKVSEVTAADQGAPTDAEASAQGEPVTTQRRRSRLALNSNLGEVSDWLTKILVGVGLTQIGRVGPAVADLSQSLGTAFGPRGSVFAGSLVVFFGVFGFITGWISSVMFLTLGLSRLLTEAVEAVQGRVAQLVESETESAVDRANEYERLVGAALARLVPTVLERVVPGHDKGVDMLVTDGQGEVAVEVKYRSRPLGVADIERVVGRAGPERRVVVVSRSGFTNDAAAFADQQSGRVHLVRWGGSEDDTALRQALSPRSA